jgi:hypothetical protein
MKQAITGVSPAQVEETTVMVVWPSIAAYGSGRWLGPLYSIKTGFYIFTIGNFLALASIPHALFLYFFRLVTGKCYKLTNRRVVEMATDMQVKFRDKFPFLIPRIAIGSEVRSVDLDRFDAIVIDRRPGQQWFDAGDLIFKLGNIETFRLEGVSRPDSFRHTCLKCRAAYVGVRKANAQQTVLA